MLLPKFSVICVLILVVVQYNDASSSLRKSRREPAPLDVSKPLGAILEKLLPVLKPGGVDLKLLLETIMKLVNCLGIDLAGIIGGIIPGLGGGSSHSIQSYKNFETMEEVISPGFFLPENITDIITEYCNSDDFRDIHNYIWVKDKQLNDVIKFLRDHGYPDIYPFLKQIYQLYKCPQALIDTLPTGPNAIKSSRQKRSTLPNVRERFLYDYALKQEEADCDIMTILMDLLGSGALKLLALLETLIDQVSTQPGLHFLVGKVQEPIKGPSFRGFRLLPASRRLFLRVNKALMSDEAVQMILKLVHDLLGIDLTEITDNLVETIVSILEGLLWWNWDIVPPYP